MKVNRNIVPEIIAKRIKFNELIALRDGRVQSILDDTDLILEEGALDFEANRSPDELGLIHLFTQSNMSPDDDFFFSEATDEVWIPLVKDKKSFNPLHDHLAPKKGKQRKDCPKYLDVVRSYGRLKDGFNIRFKLFPPSLAQITVVISPAVCQSHEVAFQVIILASRTSQVRP